MITADILSWWTSALMCKFPLVMKIHTFREEDMVFLKKGYLTCKWGEDLEIDCFLILTPLQNCSTVEEPQRKKPWPLPPSWTTGGSAARNANKAPLAVRGSASLCVATGLGFMTTGDAGSPNHYALLLLARTHLRCHIGRPSFSASFFKRPLGYLNYIMHANIYFLRPAIDTTNKECL